MLKGMLSYLAIWRNSDQQDTKLDVTLQRGRGRGRERCTGQAMLSVTSIVQGDVAQSVTGRTKSADYDPFAQAAFVQQS